MVDEPVRGRVAEPGFFSLSGIARMRAMWDGLAPTVPTAHLTGAITTHVDTGSIVGLVPELPWFQIAEGNVDTRFACAIGLDALGCSVAPAGCTARFVAMSSRDLRPCTLKGKSLSVRAHLLDASKSAFAGEVAVADSFGRAICHATARFMLEPIEPAPPPPRPLHKYESPRYSTPDPYLRPVPAEAVVSVDEVDEVGGWPVVLAAMADGSRPHPPLFQLLGIRFTSAADGFVSAAMTTSEWLLCFHPHEVSWTHVGVFAHLAMTSAAATVTPHGHGLSILDETVTLVRAAALDRGELLTRASISHVGPVILATAEVTDGGGALVAVGSQTSLATRRQDRRPEERERVLGTVLFTDIVGSTAMAKELGDDAWGTVLDNHDRVVRAQLQAFRGREVKTTGDGFLATFDSPTRAVQCARAIRDGVSHLGLQVRAGLHTGEYEPGGGDITGLAVHVASRIQAVAEPGEILVSNTVRDLVAGSGLRLTDRGSKHLKGLDGDWPLSAILA